MMPPAQIQALEERGVRRCNYCWLSWGPDCGRPVVGGGGCVAPIGSDLTPAFLSRGGCPAALPLDICLDSLLQQLVRELLGVDWFHWNEYLLSWTS